MKTGFSWHHVAGALLAAPALLIVGAIRRDAWTGGEANAIVVYAWNEHDKDGWLVPTRGANGQSDTSRLDAIRPLLLPRGLLMRPAPAKPVASRVT